MSAPLNNHRTAAEGSGAPPRVCANCGRTVDNNAITYARGEEIIRGDGLRFCSMRCLGAWAEATS